MRFGLLCGIGPRANGFADALKTRGHSTPRHLAYEQFVKDKDVLRAFLQDIDVLRIDSPGGGYDIWKCFSGHIGMPTSGYQKQYGQIYPQAPFVHGTYGCVKLACDLAYEHSVPCTVDPQAVQCFMDKHTTHKLCAPSLSTPEALPEIKNWAELNAAMKARDIRNVFMKLRYGSAASGVLAIETFGSKLRVWTSVELIDDRSGVQLFNSLKIRKYLDKEAKRLIDIVATMGVHTETWIPKLQLEGKPSDLRLVVVGGVPVHCVVRRSASPLTNLHLNNERLSTEEIRHKLPSKIWDEILDMGTKAGQFFPKHLCIGVDIAIHRESKTPYLLEVNAFGDHLNDVYYDELNPYEFQIRHLEKKYA